MTLQDWLASLTGAPRLDPVATKVKERIEVAKFDKTSVTTPGVDGLTAYEVVVIEDNQVVEVRHPLGRDAVP